MKYHFFQAWRSIRANLTAAAATLSTMTLTLTLLGLVSLTILNLERIVTSIERDVQITAFLTPSANDVELKIKVQEIEDQIKKLSGVISVSFASKDQVYQQLENDYSYLISAKQLIDNPLSDEIRVKLRSVSQINEVAAKIKTIENVSDVEYGSEAVANVIKTINSVRIGGYGLVILLVLNSLFNILNSIRIAMFARRREIKVMRLIGATPGFIRIPYLLEGMGLGLISGLLTAAILYPAYVNVAPKIQSLISFVQIIRDPKIVIILLLILIVFGILIGLVGSLIATNRYLRGVE